MGLALALALTFTAACEGDECSVESREVRAGEVFDVYAYGHDFSPFCGAGFESAQEHARWVAEAWGEPPTSFDYKLFESREDGCWPCRSDVKACAWPTRLATTDLPHHHEIAHSVRGLPCPSLLEEGWAMLYGSPFSSGSTLGDLREAADSYRSGTLAFEFYPLAARFVAFLLETRGLGGLKQLCKQRIDNSASLDAALREVFGASLDEISAEFEDYPAWPLGNLVQDHACEGTDITSAPGSWSMNLECGAPGVEGREGGRIIAHHLVELPEQGWHVFRFDAPREFFVRLELRSCAREGMASTVHEFRRIYGYGTPKEILFTDLPAGVYVFRLELEDSSDPLPLEMSVWHWL